MDQPDNRAFFGLGGQGKTTLALHQARAFPRVLIHDVNGEAKMAASAIVTSDPRELVELFANPGPVRVCWRGAVMQADSGRLDAFEWANRVALACCNVVVIWDELDRFNIGGRLPPNADIIVNSGRHRELRAWFTSRRPAAVPVAARALAGRKVIFRTDEPRDVDYYAEVIGRELAERVPDLAVHQCFDARPGVVDLRKPPFD
jgi:hypothetical protein